MVITDLTALDLRFPTSRTHAGTDAVHVDPDYSAAYVVLRTGYPAYTTSVGWMGYTDDGVRALCREALEEGWTHFKVKVGGPPDDDRRRVALVREAIGDDRTLMIDANSSGTWGPPSNA